MDGFHDLLISLPSDSWLAERCKKELVFPDDESDDMDNFVRNFRLEGIFTRCNFVSITDGGSGSSVLIHLRFPVTDAM